MGNPLTKDQIRAKKSNYYLLSSCLCEIQMELHSGFKGLKLYSSSTHEKLKKLQVDFERTSSKNHKLFVQDGGSESELLNFYRITNIIQKVMNKLMDHSHDFEKMPKLLSLLEDWEAGDLVFVNSHEELVEIAGKSGSGKLEVREEASHA